MLSASRRKWDNHSRRLASIDRAKELLGYNPQTPLEIGLRHTIAWFVENWDKIDAAASFAPGMSSAVREMVVNQDDEDGAGQSGLAANRTSLHHGYRINSRHYFSLCAIGGAWDFKTGALPRSLVTGGLLLRPPRYLL